MDGVDVVGIEGARHREADRHGPDVRLHHACACAVRDRDDAACRKLPDRASHRLATDRKGRGEIPFARQGIADLQDPRGNQGFKLVADLVLDGALVHPAAKRREAHRGFRLRCRPHMYHPSLLDRSVECLIATANGLSSLGLSARDPICNQRWVTLSGARPHACRGLRHG